MAKQKRKLTPAEKAAKRQRRKEYMAIFINGRQKRVKRPTTIDGMDAEEFIRRNAAPVWLHQNEMREYIYANPKATPHRSSQGKNGMMRLSCFRRRAMQVGAVSPRAPK